jgi:hypothetical protein
LFNSYYEAKGARVACEARGFITWPALDDVVAYGGWNDHALRKAIHILPVEAIELVILEC